MHGRHARSASTPPGLDSGASRSGRSGARHARRGRSAGRLRRRIVAYRDVDLLAAPVPAGAGPAERCLLLVHVRRVVGQVRYRICPRCARGVISTLTMEERFTSTGLDTRALSHLRSRHPDVAWFSSVSMRTTRDLMKRMRVQVITGDRPCAHMGREDGR